MRVAPSAFAAFRGEITLARIGEVEEKLIRLRIEHLRAHRHPDDRVLAVFARSVRALAVTAALGFVLGVVAKMKKRVQSLGGFHPHAAADTAVTARRAAARDEFLTPESRDAVTAVAGLYPDFYAVEEHDRM